MASNIRCFSNNKESNSSLVASEDFKKVVSLGVLTFRYLFVKRSIKAPTVEPTMITICEVSDIEFIINCVKPLRFIYRNLVATENHLCIKLPYASPNCNFSNVDLEIRIWNIPFLSYEKSYDHISCI